ncbi:MAG: terminase large subunit [Rubrivivax sp.]
MLRGEILVGRLVYLAVKRHYVDLQEGPRRGLRFSPPHAWHVIRYIERYYVHVKGPKAGKPLLLDPWQVFWTAVLYGWLNAEGLRRFRIGVELVARKNGKSTWKAPQGGYLHHMDGEQGAEVYAIATTRDQAMTVFKPAYENIRRWARRSPGMARSFKISTGQHQEKIETVGTAPSVFQPLPANDESLDGKNPSAILFDELHAQKTPDVWNVMITAFGARLQPLLSAITTAGFILDGICVDMRQYLISVLEGRRLDDAFFGYCYEAEQGDDYFAEPTWRKANPGLGLSKTLEYMRSQARLARALPSARVNFLTKDLNVWVNSADGWFDLSVWDKGARRPVNLETLRGRRCYAGLDLASTRDLTSLSLVFPPDDADDEWQLAVFFWCPDARIKEREKDDIARYTEWRDAGWLVATPGDVTDYAPVKERLRWVRDTFDLQQVGFDRWNSLQLINELLEAQLPMVEVPQTTGGMYPGSKLLEELTYSKRLLHGGNPVLRYCAANVSLLYDSNGNFRPDKKRSKAKGRIDGIVSTVMALGRALTANPDMHAQAFVDLNSVPDASQASAQA